MRDRRPRRYWKWLLLVGLISVGVLFFPWMASAFQVERAGRGLDDALPAQANYQTAERHLLRALHWKPGNYQAYRMLAQLYAQQGNRSGAADAWAHFAALRPEDPQGYWELAAACEGLEISDLAQLPGQPCGADAPARREKLIDLWRRAGQSGAGFVRAGDSFRVQEELAQAMAFYRRALLLSTAQAGAAEAGVQAQAWRGLGELFQAQGDAQAALDAYAQAATLSQDPELTASVRSSRGRILADAGRWEEACDEMALAVALLPDQGQVHLDYGLYLFRAGRDPALARRELAQAAALMPANPWPHVHRAALEFVAKDYAAALDHSRRAVKLQPDLFWGWVWEAKALAELGRLEDAEKSLRRATELAPDKAAPYADLGQLLERRGRLDEALVQYQQAVQLAPGDVLYWSSLADAYRADGQVEYAVAAYRQVLELDTANAAARQALQELGH